MSKRRDKEFLADIKAAIERINSYVDDITYDEFLQKPMTQDAVIRNLEVIGEAIKNLTPALRKKHNEVLWKELAGLRDKIIHFYFGIKWSIVWSVIKEKLPELEEKVLKKWENANNKKF